jgi:sugar phosphate isomerase/epimerase
VKIGLFLALFADRSLEEALDAAKAADCEAVEIAVTGAHGHPDLAALAAARDLEVSALSCHGNPLHPDESIAEAADRGFRDAVRLAAASGVETVITFAGCPGESEHSRRPSWVTCSWPDDYPETLEWQWRERVVPYWEEAAAFAGEIGVRVAIEPHPGFVVYNTATMLRLREAVGPAVGANFDPSHLFWQQIDPLVSARALRGSIFHMHAKDTVFDERRLALDGVLETRIPTEERSWSFCSVGDGHPVEFWRDLVSALRDSGYDGALSIEHEDPARSLEDGVARAVATLRAALEPAGAA